MNTTNNTTITDKLNTLKDTHIIDTYIRGQLIEHIYKHTNPEHKQTNTLAKAEHQLRNGKPGTIRTVAANTLGPGHPITRTLTTKHTLENIKTLHTHLDTTIDEMRDQIKHTIQHTNTPQTTMYRDRINHHYNNPHDLTDTADQHTTPTPQVTHQ